MTVKLFPSGLAWNHPMVCFEKYLKILEHFILNLLGSFVFLWSSFNFHICQMIAFCFLWKWKHVPQDNPLSQVVASFYILLVMMLVGTNLGMVRGRRRVISDKESSLQGERIQCQVVAVGECKTVDDVWELFIFFVKWILNIWSNMLQFSIFIKSFRKVKISIKLSPLYVRAFHKLVHIFSLFIDASASQ